MRINLLSVLLLLIGITTMYHLLPKMKGRPVVTIHPRGFHQTWNVNRSQLVDAIKKPTPIATRARARRCADNCILREFMEIQI